MNIVDIHGTSVSHGTKAPIANDWISPRPKIAAITNGVGSTQQTLTKNSEPIKSRNEEASVISTNATTMINSTPVRLN